MRPQSPLPLLLVIAVTLWAACTEQAPAETPPAGAQGPPPALVVLGTARDGTLSDRVSYLGRVRAIGRTELAPAVDARVLEVTVREGDHFDKGQELVRLGAELVEAEERAAQAEARRLRALLRQSRKQLARVEAMKFPAVSEPERERQAVEVESLAAELQVLQARAERAAVIVKRHHLYAPFSGVVSARLADPGAWGRSGEPLLSLLSDEGVEVLVDVASELRGQVKVGDAARVLGPERADVTVAGVVPAMDPATRTMRLRLRPTGEHALLPGMAVRVEFDRTIAARGVIVPRDALVQGPASSRVVKVVDGKATPVIVKIFATADAEAMVEGEGLVPGDALVVRGNERLRPGQPVRTKE